MTANINPDTGIRYGVVSLNTLADWVWDEFFTSGTNLTAKEAESDYLAEFQTEHGREPGDEDWQEFWDGYEADEECYSLETDGMRLELSYLGGAAIVFVLESPHIGQARECSPCVPNAGDLDNRELGGFDCYSLPDEWFRTADEVSA